MASMFIFTGVLGILVALGAYLFPAVRNIDKLLPDHDESQGKVEAESQPEPVD